MIKAVIFDMDGTLIDTEKYYRIFWPKALAHFGYEMSDEQALSMRSLGCPYAPKHLKEMFHDPNLDYDAIRAYRKKIMEEALQKNGIELKKGAIELLEFLKTKKIKRAIATAPNGVMRANLAGCKVVLVPDQSEPEEELKDKLYGCVESLDKIEQYFL